MAGVRPSTHVQELDLKTRREVQAPKEMAIPALANFHQYGPYPRGLHLR